MQDDSQSTVQPADEIKITPEMIEAGAEAIKEEIGDPMDVSGWFTADGLAEKVYRAMSAVDLRARCL